jgi:hypothetical protein
MRTLIVSDLHLGGLSGVDLLRRADVRATLLEALQGVDRLVLLGDSLELRHGPPHEALAASRAFFEDVGRAIGGDGELILTAGNHDHLLVSAWLDARALRQPRPEPLTLEHRIAPSDASAMAAQIASWAAPARVELAYPGVWLREDVYAMHGHYLDCHLTIPTLERLGMGLMGRLLERREHALASVEDYEAITAPVYAWRDAMARYARTGPALNGVGTVRAWRALGGGRAPAPDPATAGARHAAANGSRPSGARDERIGASVRALRVRALKATFPLAVGAINRAGLGPVSADISGEELRRSGLFAMAEVATRLGLRDCHFIFGHTHRAGPLPGDEPEEWRRRAPGGADGVRLINSGSWIYESTFLSRAPGESPYWPGACVRVQESGPPVLERLLSDRTHGDLAPLSAADH